MSVVMLQFSTVVSIILGTSEKNIIRLFKYLFQFTFSVIYGHYPFFSSGSFPSSDNRYKTSERCE